MAVYRQTSFVGGMLSPSLEGRTDYKKRLAGARLIHNFLVTPYGTLRRRPGIRYAADVYGSRSNINPTNPTTLADGNAQARLIQFRGHDNQDHLIVLTHMKATIINNGDVGNAVTINTPWEGKHLRPDPTDSDKPGVKWSQSGTRLLITHPDYEPTYLVAPQVSGGSWAQQRASAVDSTIAVDSSVFSADYVAAEGPAVGD